jgi:spermidine dehydrogenase
MNRKDSALGMGRRIRRRDLLQGLGAFSAVAMSGSFPARAVQAATAADYYPPRLTGMRGNHPGSFDVAHPLAREGKSDWSPVADPGERYDLVVVGGGISGLSAAWFYREENPGAHILVLDNHDDFGGHARRNEFVVDGHRLIGYGGSQTMEAFSAYSETTRRLLEKLGIDFGRFFTAFDQDFYRRQEMGAGLWFDQANWGVDRLVPFDLNDANSYLPIADSRLEARQAVAQMPLSAAGRREMLHLLTHRGDELAGVGDRRAYLSRISYRTFLARHLGVTQAEVFRLFQNLAVDSCVGIDAAPAASAMGYNGLPGWQATGLPREESDPYIAHFPSGNAGVARLLVRSLVPAVAAGHSMEDIATAEFDYSRLDREGGQVRLRLNSTAVRAVNRDGGVDIDYVRGGSTRRVRAAHCVLACYHSIIPHLCPEMPPEQKAACAEQVKAPILYTNVALRNWRAWKELGLAFVLAPTGYHTLAKLDFPVSLGDYRFSQNPDQPIVVHMEKFFHVNNQGLPPADQRRTGRQELFETSFETLEREIRSQLAAMLSGGGFDPARDIAGITVNRWAHGYSYTPNALWDERYQDPDDARYAHVRARQPVGHIHLANSDAGARAWMPTAIEQAARAVSEIS